LDYLTLNGSAIRSMEKLEITQKKKTENVRVTSHCGELTYPLLQWGSNKCYVMSVSVFLP